MEVDLTNHRTILTPRNDWKQVIWTPIKKHWTDTQTSNGHFFLVTLSIDITGHTQRIEKH